MKNQDDASREIGLFLLGIASVVFLPGVLLVLKSWKRPHFFSAKDYFLRLSLSSLALGILVKLRPFSSLTFAILVLWCLSLIIGFAVLPLIRLLKRDTLKIRLSDLESRVSLKRAVAAFMDPSQAVVGADFKTGLPVSLHNSKRTAHVLVIGATGTGKTTLMKNLILHAIRHEQPCVIIDPKGDDQTIDQIRRYWMKTGAKRPLRVFSMSRPEYSARYNPLKYGNANQLKDRLMEAFNWSEQYYESIAGSFLTALTSATCHLGLVLNLNLLSKLISNRKSKVDFCEILKTYMIKVTSTRLGSTSECRRSFLSQRMRSLWDLLHRSRSSIIQHSASCYHLRTPVTNWT